jgi:redox-sensitive bicupin YhaK (pirin superfamily)
MRLVPHEMTPRPIVDPANAPQFAFHPHSGIATLTLILSGQAFYKESTGREGIIESGGVEWMRASGSVWHTGGMQIFVSLLFEFSLAQSR